MILSWSPVEGALAVAGSRRSAVETMWRLVPEGERTPARRRLVLALVDHIREHEERTGHLAPAPAERPEHCCNGHHFEGCTDGGPGCCPRCPINPTDEETTDG